MRTKTQIIDFRAQGRKYEQNYSQNENRTRTYFGEWNVKIETEILVRTKMSLLVVELTMQTFVHSPTVDTLCQLALNSVKSVSLKDSS